MSIKSPFTVIVLNIFAGIIGGVTVNLFTDKIDLIQLLLVAVVGCITYCVINIEMKKEGKEND